jgi:hypothetical protein
MAKSNNVLGSVFIFNTTASQVYVTVNNGPDRTPIFPASTIAGWMPGQIGRPVDLCQSPGPGVFGLGRNFVDITPASAGGTVSTQIDVPSSVKAGDSLQIYLSMESTQADMWMMLCNGKPIAGNVHF